MTMLTAKADVATEHASLNLKKLCRHFGHKTEATFDDHQGEIRFPFGGVGQLAAEGDRLTLTVRADNEEALNRTEQVLASHLVRFAHKEDIQVQWQPLQ